MRTSDMPDQRKVNGRVCTCDHYQGLPFCRRLCKDYDRCNIREEKEHEKRIDLAFRWISLAAIVISLAAIAIRLISQ